MIVRRALPDPRLSPLVRHYQARTADLGNAVRRIVLPARTDVLLEFYFTAPHLLELQRTGTHERAPAIAAVGPQTHRRVDLILSGRMDIFTIHFTPSGLHVLTGVPMNQLADAGIDGAALFGAPAMARLQGRLAAAASLTARARLADAFLLGRWNERGQHPTHPVVADALARLRRVTGMGPVGGLADAMALSPRHFRRLFEEQVGMAPKRYARIVRLEAAIAAKADAPSRSWTDIAHDGGWFDQAHMDKDFRALAGTSPSRFVVPTPAVAVPY